jgi:hypothetical protein
MGRIEKNISVVNATIGMRLLNPLIVSDKNISVVNATIRMRVLKLLTVKK